MFTSKSRCGDLFAVILSYTLAVIYFVGMRLAYPRTHQRRMQMREVLTGMMMGIAFMFLAAIVLAAPF